jgi:hypothetical protein
MQTAERIAAADGAADLRLLYYQDRSSWPSMDSPALRADEFDLQPAASGDNPDHWGAKMALDEALKRHLRRALRDVEFTDVVLMDIVSAFVFPHLLDSGSERVFLESWEWVRYIRPRFALQRKWLWELPVNEFLAHGTRVLEALFIQRPDLKVIFHVARPCFNDGVRFGDPQLAAHVEFFCVLSERVASTFCRRFQRFQAVSPPDPRADPRHGGSMGPFAYDASYLAGLHHEIVRLIY